jgi:hypothetical protein
MKRVMPFSNSGRFSKFRINRIEEEPLIMPGEILDSGSMIFGDNKEGEKVKIRIE